MFSIVLKRREVLTSVSTFLFGALVGSKLSSIPVRGSLGAREPYRFRVVFQTSEATQLEQLKQHRKTFLDENKFDLITSQFQKDGRLLHSGYTTLAGGSHAWNYVFRSRRDQRDWERLSGEFLTHHYASQNFKIDVQWAYVAEDDFNRVLSVDKTVSIA